MLTREDRAEEKDAASRIAKIESAAVLDHATTPTRERYNLRDCNMMNERRKIVGQLKTPAEVLLVER
jgi:hypothetical protein